MSDRNYKITGEVLWPGGYTFKCLNCGEEQWSMAKQTIAGRTCDKCGTVWADKLADEPAPMARFAAAVEDLVGPGELPLDRTEDGF